MILYVPITFNQANIPILVMTMINDYVPTIFPGNKSGVLDIELAPIELSESTSVPADKKLIDMDHGMYLRKHNSIFCYHYCLSNVFI